MSASQPTNPTPEELERAREIVDDCICAEIPICEETVGTHYQDLIGGIAAALHARYSEGLEAAANIAENIKAENLRIQAGLTDDTNNYVHICYAMGADHCAYNIRGAIRALKNLT